MIQVFHVGESCPSDASKLILSGAPHDPVYNKIEKHGDMTHPCLTSVSKYTKRKKGKGKKSSDKYQDRICITETLVFRTPSMVNLSSAHRKRDPA